ncbi:TonB-dependent receptor [Pelomonas sp. UHG3]|uniref:TonB-dependent receptor n=1 Tax=Roseateles hydrophilus TaxID=2975054 RepID=A0ACC6C5E1_9BURK|nr:TonB-dependent receptor [Pelomonas sp. UHG3]MCY4743605.1 TonB-dependent receptor [Pelomonas sp. UHG3]
MKSGLFCKTATALAVSLLATGTVYAQEAAKEEAAPRAKEDSVRLGTITVVGSSAKLGTGMMLQDDSVKGRSTVTQAAMEKELGTGNVLQSIALLPGVSTYNYDATGLFGGDVAIRGFASDQIGFTVNGVPVNDSGGYAFYAQEMIDKENVCTASVAQGSPELESPNSGATGGAVSMITCDPTDKRRARFTQTVGGLNLKRTFVRLDSGRFLDNKAKVFLSYSHAEVDKWKGLGSARKDHIDAGFSLDLNEDNKILGSILYNRMVNNNISNVSLAQLNNPAQGYFYDFTSPTFTPLKTPGPGAQTDVAQSPIYYGMSLNPFKNVIASVSGSFKLANDTYLKVQPYMWYGFGNGGWSQTLLQEGTMPIGGAVDINGDGDTLDRVAVGRASVTKTMRPGVTAEVNTTYGNHFLKVGLWYERADHRQTQPAVKIGADGVPTDIWLQENCIKRATGDCYSARNTKTISTVYQLYVNDQISLFDDRAFINFGLKLPTVVRDVTNLANETGYPTYTGSPGSYVAGARVYDKDFNIKRTFREVLPQLGARFKVGSRAHVFANVSKNFRAPPNYAYMVSSSGVYVASINGGAVQPIKEIDSETTVMLDAGYRYQSRDLSFTATFFNSDFKDRQVQVVDEESKLSTYLNAGGVKNRGMELEVGSGVYSGFSAYGSVTLQKSRMKQNLQLTATGALPTAGKQFAKTPELMGSMSVQYEQGPVYLRLKGKYTASQYADLMNQQAMPGHSVFDLDAGYKFSNWGMLKNPKLRLNVSNLGNTQARAGVSSIVSNTVATPLIGTGTQSANTAFYYLLAPRLTSLTFSVDFE